MSTPSSTNSASKSPGDPPPSRAARYHFLMPVWGIEYVDRLIDVGLPSQLAPGNLPSLPPEKCVYQIFTRGNDLPRLRAAKSFQRLQSLVTVVVTTIDAMDLSHPYTAMTACYEQGIRASRGIDAAFVFLTPDSIWSDGAFAAMDELQNSGKRAVVVTGLRMREEVAVDALRCRYYSSERHSLAVGSRDLVALCLENLHPLSVAHLCEDGRNHSLGHYYYRVGNGGLLARCVHIHPLMVRPAVPDQAMETTLDHEYVRRSCPDFRDVHMVTDSDELFCVEFSKSTLHANMISSQPVGDEPIDDFMYQWTNSYHREFFRRTIRFHASDVDEAAWESAQRCSDALVEEILGRLYGRENWDDLHEMRVIRNRYLPAKSPNFLRRNLHRAKRLSRRVLGMTYRGLASLLPISRTVKRLRADTDLLTSKCLTLHDRISRLEAALAEVNASQNESQPAPLEALRPPAREHAGLGRVA